MQLRTPVTGLTRASPYRPVGYTFVWWDLFNRIHPLGNIVEFHERSLNPNDLDLAWREHFFVMPTLQGSSSSSRHAGLK